MYCSLRSERALHDAHSGKLHRDRLKTTCCDVIFQTADIGVAAYASDGEVRGEFLLFGLESVRCADLLCTALQLQNLLLLPCESQPHDPCPPQVGKSAGAVDAGGKGALIRDTRLQIGSDGIEDGRFHISQELQGDMDFVRVLPADGAVACAEFAEEIRDMRPGSGIWVESDEGPD